MITYKRELLSRVEEQVVQLARKSFKEVDPRIKNAFDVDINMDLYKAMEAGGNHAIFVAEEDGVILGYLSVTMSESPHIKGYWQAVQDSMYVDAESRKYKIAVNLIKEAEKYAKEVGCSSMTIGFKYKNPHEKFAIRMGYEPDDVMHTKLLEEI